MLWKCLVVICALFAMSLGDNLSYNPCPGFIQSAILPDSISSTQCLLKNATSTSFNNVCKLFFPSVFTIQLVLDVKQFINFSVVVTTNNVNSMSDPPITLAAVTTCGDVTDSLDPDDDDGIFHETCNLQIDTSPLFTGFRGFCFSFIGKYLLFTPI